jgi:hypothetical protein
MAQQNDTGVGVVIQLDPFSRAPSRDPSADDLAIFSRPGVEAVFHWWLESNRRWTERNRTNPLIPTPASGAPPQR